MANLQYHPKYSKIINRLVYPPILTNQPVYVQEFMHPSPNISIIIAGHGSLTHHQMAHCKCIHSHRQLMVGIETHIYISHRMIESHIT